MNLLRTSSQISIFRSVIVYFLVYCMFFNASLPVLLAGPEGAQVVNGNVTINQSGYNTTITASDKAIINYSSFDISRPEIVQFIQPGTSASVLNRILSANPTNINGTLLANGRVFFVNPAGVYFGNGAQVNVNQLVASALDITDADFINGRYNFAGGEGSVINAGDICAEKVYLIGRQVANSGSISCPAGFVVMASGDRVFLGEPGSDIVLEIDGPSLPESSDPVEGSGVLNEGKVEAAGGTIVLAAAGDIYSQAISNVGSLSVSSETSDGGDIRITGEYINNEGTIKANAGDNAKAGNINIIAQQELTLGETSLLEAKGKDIQSSGGNIYLYSYGDAYAKNGQVIDISGGTISGDGGVGELSAFGNVSMAGSVLGYAQDGYETGKFIIDPLNASISGNYAADTTVWAEDNITIDGATTIDTSGGDVTLSLFADHLSATGGDWDDGSGTGTSGTGTITRSGDYTIAKSGSNTAGLVMKAADDGVGSGGIGTSVTPIKTDIDTLNAEIRSTSSGSIYITETDGVDIQLANAGSGNVTITAGGNVTDSGAITAATLTVKTLNDAGAAITLNDTSNDADTIDLRARNAADGADAAGAISFVDIDGVDIAKISTTSTASVTAGDAVTQSGSIDAATLTVKTLNDAGAAITLNDTSNDADTIDLRARNAADGADASGAISFVDIDGVDIAKISTTSTASVTAGDAVTQSGSIDAATLTVKTLNDAGAAITLNDTSNDADTIDLRARNAADGADAAGAISFADADSVDIAKISTTSPATVTAGDAILVSGSISAGGSTTTLTAGGDITINANITDSMAIDAHSGTDGTGDVTFGAGVTLDAPTINLRSGDGPSGAANAEVDIMTNTPTIVADTLTIQQDSQMGDSVTPWNPNVTNNASIDLILLSDESLIYTTDADSWQSITAEAKDNIELWGSGDIKIAATGILSHEGGVKVISNSGSIYTPGAGDTLNAPITGYSDESTDTGVDLPYASFAKFIDPGSSTKAAIVIRSPNEDLKLGPDAILTANGTYDPTQFDDRLSFLVDFWTAEDLRGDPVDVAIYLGNGFSGRNVSMGSGSVWINNKSLTEIGTLAIDADDTVTFTDAFENSLPGSTVRRLEVISRISSNLTAAIIWERLPHADNPSLLADGLYLGTYVLRGRDLLFTQVLKKQEEAPLVPPKLEEPEEEGAVEEPDTEALIALLEELGIGVQPYMARAYRHEKSGINTLNTDLRLFKAAEKLQKLIPMLEDTEGTRIVALRVVVGQFFSTLASISDEQMASFRQELARHVDDGTDYDLAGQTIASLTDYVEILSTDIGWPTDRSMAFVMGRYIPRLTEGDAIRTAVVQIQLQEALGI